MDLSNHVDIKVVEQIEYFFIKIQENALHSRGIIDSYDDDGIPALGKDVEYFLPIITADDRMNYIAQNIVALPDSKLSARNKVCNTLISHFYGARGIHQTVTQISDVKKAHVDFERMIVDDEYRLEMRGNLKEAQLNKIPIYGSTELRTSLYGAANALYMKNHDDIENRTHPGNILEWVSSFIADGTVDSIIQSESLKETTQILQKQPGLGQYFSYHGATSNSVNPNLNFHHDERFVMPGPGCCKTLKMMFPNLSKKECSLGDQVIWTRDNQKELFPNFKIHKVFHNILNESGDKIFKDEQDELKCYTNEVGDCQFSVYHRLLENPHLANRRKVARAVDTLEADKVFCDLVNF